VLERRPPLEFVGEGAETYRVQAKLFPAQFGGLSSLSALYQRRRMDGESFIHFGERVARELCGVFKIRGNEAILGDKAGAAFPARRLVRSRHAEGSNFISWDIAPRMGRPQFRTWCPAGIISAQPNGTPRRRRSPIARARLTGRGIATSCTPRQRGFNPRSDHENELESSARLCGQNEGGNFDHPNDEGGPTNFGVTERVHNSWRRMRGCRRAPSPQSPKPRSRPSSMINIGCQVARMCCQSVLIAPSSTRRFHHGVVAAGRRLQQAINALSPRKIAEDARSARSPSTWRMMSAEKADQHHARSTHRLHENTRWLGPPSRRAGATA
jgi:hypothetical protein